MWGAHDTRRLCRAANRGSLCGYASAAHGVSGAGEYVIYDVEAQQVDGSCDQGV